MSTRFFMRTTTIAAAAAVAVTLCGCQEVIDKLYKKSGSVETTSSCEDLRDQEKYREAIECYEEELKKKPNEVDFYDNIAYCYFQLGEHEKAILTADKALKLNPKDEYAYDYRAASKYQLKQYNEAIEDFSKEIELDANEANAFLQRGDVYSDMKKPELAIRDYTEAIGLDPNNAAGYYSRGLVYFQEGRAKEAREDFTEAVKLDKEEKTHHANLGTSQAELGEYDKAIDSYNSANECDPNWCDSYLHKGTLYLWQGKNKEAENEFRKLLVDKINPYYSGIYLYLYYLSQHRKEEADASLKAATSARSDGDWPYAAILYLKGELSDSALFALARNGDRLSEAYGYACANELLKGNKTRGLEHLKWIEHNGNKFMPEQRLARWASKISSQKK